MTKRLTRYGLSALAAAIFWACSSSSPDAASNAGGADGGDGTGAATGDGGGGGNGTSDSGGGSSGGGDSAVPAGATLPERLTVSTLTVPAGVKPGWDTWRIWGTSKFRVAPIYTAPLANCGTLVCYTATAASGTAGEAYVAVLDANDKLTKTLDLGAFECRGLAAEPDGHFAALLWSEGTATDCANLSANGQIFVKRFDLAGAVSWSTQLLDPSPFPACPNDWSLGDSRLEYGMQKYGAYFHEHSQSGHEGDTLQYVDAKSGAATTQWGWGCSHSMSNLLRFNAADSVFMPACVTDCYPGTTGSDFTTQSQGGIYVNNHASVLNVDGGCDGSVAAELGGAAPAPHGWKTVFNASQTPMTLGQKSYDPTKMNQDIGFASVTAGLTPQSVVWLTSTPSINEADAAIERWQPAGDASEQYVVGWSEPQPSSAAYKLARVDGAGKIVEGPVDVSATARWGQRDDPFRAHVNGDVVWAWFGAAGDTKLHFARLRSGGSHTCASF